jgi:hypothetical protein
MERGFKFKVIILENNKSWTHNILPSGLKPITCKWILKI